MKRRGVQLVVLCEDIAHERFARLTLLELGYWRNKMTFVRAPMGRGAAEQWVREHYAIEVCAHRKRASRLDVRLLVLIDADLQTVRQRYAQLNRQLSDEELDPRSPKDGIVLWIPKRHIETWVAWLAGHDANEGMDCKPLARGVDVRKSAERLVALFREKDGRSSELLPSLALAFEETRERKLA